MPTPSDLKNLIDQQITNKTNPYSIDNVETGERLKDIVDLFGGKVFSTVALMNAFLTNPNAYAGLIAFNIQTDTIYYINSAGTAWVPLSTSGAAYEIVNFTNQSILNIVWDSTRAFKFGLGIFAIEVLGEDGKYRQSLAEVVPDSIVTTTMYTIDLGGPQTGRLIIK